MQFVLHRMNRRFFMYLMNQRAFKD